MKVSVAFCLCCCPGFTSCYHISRPAIFPNKNMLCLYTSCCGGLAQPTTGQYLAVFRVFILYFICFPLVWTHTHASLSSLFEDATLLSFIHWGVVKWRKVRRKRPGRQLLYFIATSVKGYGSSSLLCRTTGDCFSKGVLHFSVHSVSLPLESTNNY